MTKDDNSRMTPRRWQQVKEIFDGAVRSEPEQRSAFLSDACGGDEVLRQEVESLSRCLRKRGDLHRLPAYQVGARLLVDEKPELNVGQTISSYQIISFISRGGMAVVYLAQDTKLNRKVALKLLPHTH